MTDYPKIIQKYKEQLLKALGHLEYSYAIVKTHPTNPALLSEAQLADFESFSSRFSRVVDIYLTKYLKATILRDDPGFSGTLRDFLNQAEKLKFLTHVQSWMELRELRNIEAHTYEEELENFLKALLKNTPTLIDIKSKL